MGSTITRMKVFLLDAGDRLAKSFIQGAGVVIVGQYSGLISAVVSHHWDVLETIGIAAGSGGLMAVGSVITSYLSKLRTGTASASQTVSVTAVVAQDQTPIVLPQSGT